MARIATGETRGFLEQRHYMIATPSSARCFYLKQVREAQSVVASGSVAYSSITAMPHEVLDQRGTIRSLAAGRSM
jgi:hypothetical protein